jgi:hypothetical protein
MGAVSTLVALQLEFSRTYDEALRSDAAVTSLLGGPSKDFIDRVRNAQRHITAALAAVEFPAETHGPFPADHSLSQRGGGRVRFLWNPDCTGCMRLIELAGVGELYRQLQADIERNGRAFAEWQRYERLMATAAEQLAALNARARAVGLPGFEMGWDGRGQITTTGTVTDVREGGRVVLDCGEFVEYAVDGQRHIALFDPAGRFVAHGAGDGRWLR